jgi:replicative DNA helicase
MAGNRFNATLQENLITVLAYDNKQGRVVANMLDPNLMEGEYRMIAERCIDYWGTYGRPPGDHTADLVADILEDKHNRRSNSVRRVLQGMVALSETINTEYVMNQLRTFSRMQRFKSAIIESADKINSNAQMALPEIEELWHNLLRQNEKDFNPGMRLTDIERVLERMKARSLEFTTGIKEFDARGIVPTRGTLTLWVAAAGRGKTWALVQAGKQALADRKRVLHISLEIDEEDVAQRYYQAIFNATKRVGNVDVTSFDTTLTKLDGLEVRNVRPEFGLYSEMAYEEIFGRMEHIGVRRFDNLIIKRFPPNALTVNALRAYLDTIEVTENFIPDMIIIDYVGIMKVDAKNLRTSLGHLVLDLRALMIERNAAGVTAHQSSKAGELAKVVKSTHIAEDWSIVATADQIITYSTTDREFRHGLGRLYVAKARTEEDRFALLITQSYKMGQFCIESHPMQRAYYEYLDDISADDDEDGDGESGGDDDAE